MKDDAISRQGVLKLLSTIPPEEAITKAMLIQSVKQMDAAQPERKRGKWNITDAYPHNVYCSECYTRFAQTHWAVWEDGSLPRNFCPNCGADMREVSK